MQINKLKHQQNATKTQVKLTSQIYKQNIKHQYYHKSWDSPHHKSKIVSHQMQMKDKISKIQSEVRQKGC